MVARDGIEPPTPAFSGPRSTTELSGLGITLVVGDRQEPPRALSTSVAICRPGPFRGACRWREPATQTHPKYSNPTPYRQLTSLALSFLIARTTRTPHAAPHPTLRIFITHALHHRRARAGSQARHNPSRLAARNKDITLSRDSTRAACHPCLQRRETEPTRTLCFPHPHAQGRRPSHAPLRRRLCRNLY